MPFAAIPQWLLDTNPSDRAIRLYLTLNRYAGVKGRCFPGRKRLATDMHCSVDKVDQAKDELIAAGAIDSVMTWKAPGVRGTNEYILHFDGPGGSRQEAVTPSGNGAATPAASTPPPSRQESATPSRQESATGSRQVAAGSRSNLKQIQSEPERERTTSSLAGESSVRDVSNGDSAENVHVALVQALADAGLPRPATKTEQNDRARVIVELLTAGATPEQVHNRVKEYRRRWPAIALTGRALVKHWSSLAVMQKHVNGKVDLTNRNPANIYGDEHRVGGGHRIDEKGRRIVEPSVVRLQ